MPRPYPAEFRARAIALVRDGKPQKQTADDLGIHPVTLSKWVKQDGIDRGVRPGVPTSESTELRAARRRIRELETELAIARQAATFLREDKLRPKGSIRCSTGWSAPGRLWTAVSGRHLRPARTGTDQATTWRGHRRRAGQSHVPPTGSEWVGSLISRNTGPGKDGCTAVPCSMRSAAGSWAGRWTRRPHATLVVNALDMAIRNRRPTSSGTVHVDHGTQFTSWVLGEKIRSAGLVPSFGSIGDGLDNAMMETFWSSMQIELLDRQKWKTRVELANAIFDYIEIFHNRQRRHSALAFRKPIEYELSFTNDTLTAVS